MKNKNSFFYKIIIGFLLGITLIVPGISAASIALSMNCYEEIIINISQLFKYFKRSFLFLFPIVLGALIGLIIGFFFIKILLDKYPLYVIYFFAGLVLGSSIKFIQRNTQNKNNYLLMFIGLCIPILIVATSLFNNQAKESLITTNILIYILIGMIIALIELTPGLSATSFLISIGYFEVIVSSFTIRNLKNSDYLIIYITLFISCLIFFLLFSKLISFLLRKHKSSTNSLISGMSISTFITLLYNIEIKKIVEDINPTILYEKIFISILFLTLGVFLSLSANKNHK